MTDSPIRRVWPAPVTDPLDDGALADLYRPDPATPALRVNFVTSLDGAVELDGYSAGLSGGPDKRVFGVLRMLCDALLVGAGTLRQEGYRALRLSEPRRAWRRAHGLPEFPTLVVVSASLELDPAQAAFADAPVRPLVLTHAGAPERRRAALAPVADVLTIGKDAVDLPAALAELRARGHRQVLCEGGPRLFGTLTAADLVDELCLTVSPLLTGPGASRITTGPPSPPRALALRHALAADDVLLLRYAR
ncbi:Pyrimidine reductase, riboflavin biosynthesis [Micromonospora pattaloongensis]|uniref:Pyrimidine reductase, riboflavin biosynthesis n=1 Tax=Micromonospora pattaloongensis TaxID=405436 RepID=A0A1H3K0D4_9ACTN|nr:pyrimidine reductase family protein [Micromonospora pattaloongensis]SDY45636.1 Pyrimidine reductase, riboflavin biosynthesis [Micromonospora pattaloongensis]